MQDRLSKAVTTLEFFTSNEWQFHNDNMFMLMSKMTEEDKAKFSFDARCINWKKYVTNYCFGVQQYVLKEESNLPKARIALQRFISFYLLRTILVVIEIYRLFIFYSSIIVRSYGRTVQVIDLRFLLKVVVHPSEIYMVYHTWSLILYCSTEKRNCYDA